KDMKSARPRKSGPLTTTREAKMMERLHCMVRLSVIAILLQGATIRAQLPAPRVRTIKEHGADAVSEIARDLRLKYGPKYAERAREAARAALGHWDPGQKSGVQAVADAVGTVKS